MPGRPSAAAEKAAKWLAADGGRTASQAAAKFRLSLRQAQRLVQQLGRARPVGRPPVPRHAYGRAPAPAL